MYLFDRKKDNIEIYSMVPNKDAIKKYKQQEMEQIISAHQVLEIETNAKNKPLPNTFELKKSNPPIDIAQQDIHYTKKQFMKSEYHRLQVSERCKINPDFIDEKTNAFYLGNYNNSQIIRIYNFEEDRKRLNFIRYLLLNQDYTKQGKNNKAYIKDIINIPESLYLLELLNRGQFSLLDNKDITEQLKLFSISEYPIKSYTLRELEELSQYGISENALNNALNNVINSESIFARIRRK